MKTTVFNLVLQYTFLLIPTLVHLIHDVEEINVKKHSPVHARNALILVGIMVLLGFQLQFWALPKVSYWQYFLYASSIHLFFFSPILNLLRKPAKPLFYLGNGFWDSAWAAIPIEGRILWQGILLIAGFSFYHLLDKIL